MAISFSTLSGTPTRSGFETELAKARTWLNGGILVGDIDATSIDQVHVYRPDVFGFPKQNVEATVHQAWERERAVAENGHTQELSTRVNGAIVTGRGGFFIARLRGRTSIFVESLQKNGTWPVASLACRFRVYDEPEHPNDSVVEWSCNLVARALNNFYLSGARHPDTAGFFRIVYKQVGSSSAPTVVSGTKRNITDGMYNSGSTANEAQFCSFNMGGQTTLAPGLYDTWVEYDGSGVTTGDYETKQIVLGVSALTVEVHRA
jgi:hypothetical protein